MSKATTAFNNRQEEAVSHKDGPILVLSGAGTGKTRVVVGRISRLIASGVTPALILAITFTRKAADELRQRLAQECGSAATEITAATFHSLCLRMLRRYHVQCGLPGDFSILNEGERSAMIRAAIRQNALDTLISVADASQIISNNKNALLSPDEWMAKDLKEAKDNKERQNFIQRMGTVIKAYETAKEETGRLDFDDLLVRYYELLYKDISVRSQCQEKFRYILVDEYQDTNLVQYRILHMLAQHSHNLCVVGDDDQAIYSWRGADVENILRFPEIFKGCRIVRLEQNYRCTQSILDAANAVIAHNVKRMQKKLWTDGAKGEKPAIHCADTVIQECQYVMDRIGTLLKQGVKPGDIAVLYRVNSASAAMEEALAEKNMYYCLPRDTGLYDSPEILRILEKCDNNTDKTHATPAQQFEAVIAGTGYFQQRHAVEEANLPLPAWMDSVEALLASADRYFKSHPHARISGFSRYIRSIARCRKEPGEDVLNLLTLHSAKGLEFRAVFMIRLSDEIIPGDKCADEEEERRLFYVGMTRAKEKLFLSWASFRTDDARIRESSKPSRFIAEIPSEAAVESQAPKSNTPKTEPNPVKAKPLSPRKEKTDKPKDAEKIFAVGERVRHDRFGTGIVIKADKFLHVRFDDGIVRRFIRTAPIVDHK